MIGFAVLHLAPGGPLAQFALVPGMSQADIARIAAQMGLDRPLPVQYWDWFSRLLPATGAAPTATASRCSAIIGSHLCATLELMVSSTLIAILLGVWIGILGAVRRYSLVRLPGHDRRHGGAVDPDLLVRPGRDLRLLGQARLAAGRQHVHGRRRLLARLPASPDRAVARAGAGRRWRSGAATCAPRCWT